MASSASYHSHKRRKNKSLFLPVDLILHEVFPKLPVKSLLRLKSVCKLFKTLISSPAFIDLHLRQSLSSDVDDRLLILAGQKEEGHLTYAADLNSLELPVRTFDFKYQLIVGSCNGLVCMHSLDQSSLIIFNPCTETYKNIPIPSSGHRISRYGFGYVNINDDYKVISLRFCYGSPREKEVTVYSLKSGEWSVPITTPCPYAIQYVEIGATLVGNNLLYWTFYSRNSQKHIACFDLQTNRWIEDIPFPDSIRENRIALHACRLHLGVVDNEEHVAKQSWAPSCQYSCICKPSLVSIAGGQTMYNMVKYSAAVNTESKRSTRNNTESH